MYVVYVVSLFFCRLLKTHLSLFNARALNAVTAANVQNEISD